MPSMLNKINSPNDLVGLSEVELNILCKEIRSFLIECVVDTGGHLASNLGIVELSVALMLVFSSKHDRIIFDVGHQCYTHKILTGRKDGFAKLRQKDGLSGFPSPNESIYDCFVTGHGNTALSAAVGMANAKKIKGEPGTVIAVIGDGSFGGGMVYEGMNNIYGLNNLVVILNDNKMSISKNVGNFSSYLNSIRLSEEYVGAKHGTSVTLKKIPVMGDALIKGIRGLKTTIRQALYQDTFFEMMGFQYFGPVDGHDLNEIRNILTKTESLDAPIFIHAVTQKGKGLKEAEQNPRDFHSVSPRVIKRDVQKKDYSAVFGSTLCQVAERDKKLVAITAAMKDGTGLSKFAKRYPKRFFDVGMAEQHAVTFAAGIAKEGLNPVIAIYSTFLQRGYDQILNDIHLNSVDVMFGIDRAGLVPADGETHQGIYDVAYLSQPKGSVLIAPSNYKELKYWVDKLSDMKGIRSIRYPRGQESDSLCQYDCTGNDFDIIYKSDSAKTVIISYGDMVSEAIKATDLLKQSNILCDIIKMIKLSPFPIEIIDTIKAYDTIVFLHDDIVVGGIGERMCAILQTKQYTGRFIDRGITAEQVPCGTVSELRRELKLDSESIADLLRGVNDDKT